MSGKGVAYFRDRAEMMDEKDKFVGAQNRTVIGYQGSLKQGDPEFSLFKGIATIMKFYGKFVAYDHDDGLIEMPNIEVFRPDGTSTKTPFDQQVKIIQLMNFIRGESLQYFDPYNPLDTWRYDNAPMDTVYVVATEEEHEEINEVVRQASMSMRGRLAFRWIEPIAVAEISEATAEVSSGHAILKQSKAGKTYTVELPEDKKEWAAAFNKLAKHDWSVSDQDTEKISDEL